MIDWLPEDSPPDFPQTNTAQKDPNGLLAAGGLLTPSWLLKAYRQGIFPWFDDESPILWWSPAPRMVLQPKDFHISKSLKKLMRQHTQTPPQHANDQPKLNRKNNSPHYKITCNQAFQDVITACSQPRDNEDGTWITDDMIEAYIRLNANNICHSVECWDNKGNLVGGLYGLLIDRVFFGESMFNRANNASKLSFAFFADYLFSSGVELIDCQMHSDHMERFGAKEVEREEFEKILKSALALPRPIKLPVLLTT